LLCLLGLGGVSAWVAEVNARGPRHARQRWRNALAVIRAVLHAEKGRAEAALAAPHEQGEISPYVDLASLLVSPEGANALGVPGRFEAVPISAELRPSATTAICSRSFCSTSTVSARASAAASRRSRGRKRTARREPFLLHGLARLRLPGRERRRPLPGQEAALDEDPILDQSRLKQKAFHSSWRRFEGSQG
jgi:hypothetical protein